METKTIKMGIAAAILASGLLYGGNELLKKQEIRDARMSLIEQREFTRNNPESCSVPEKFNKDFVMDERCLTYEENLLLMREMNAVKQIKIDDGELRTFEEIFDKKLLD